MVWPAEAAEVEAEVVTELEPEQAGERMAVAKPSRAPHSFDTRYHRIPRESPTSRRPSQPLRRWKSGA